MTTQLFAAADFPRHVSFSQRNAFTYCGEQFRLTKQYKIPEKPSWWLCGGSAFHSVTELMDRKAMGQDVVVPTFAEALESEYLEQLSRNPDATDADFRAAGRATNAWPNKEDRAWWLHHGPVMVTKYRDFMRTVPWDFHEVPAATFGDPGHRIPAIELELNHPIQGASIKLFIDRVVRRRSDGALGIVDLKSGSSTPASDGQLGLYKVAMEREYGEQIGWGAFYDARGGHTSEVYDLRSWTPERVEWEYETFRVARDAGLMLPNPGRQCSGCAVKDFCYVQNGARADEVPRPWEVEQVSGEQTYLYDPTDGA